MSVDLDPLARAAADGDREAFGLLVERVYDRVFAYAVRVTGSCVEAEDLAQDICAALPVKLRGWRGEGALTTWLYRIVVNAARDRFRRQAVRTKAAEGWGDWEQGRLAMLAEEAVRRDWLTEAMAGLSVELRETLALVLDGVSHAEAGAVLGVSEGTVSWRISEAKKRLRAVKDAEAGEVR
ncbi:RNA polymerase sigma factor [Sagittula sp. S175]|uniref:RNA polymerase sigma factor n=1 Tax=Sagittula sp. S175 TaxID=3415129 RepID=UPI003C7BA36E